MNTLSHDYGVENLVLAKNLLPTCGACGKPISGKYVEAGNKTFHPQCFVCDRCKHVIDTPYKIDHSRYFHADCYKEMAGLICAHCRGLLGEKWTVFKGKKYHPDCYKKYVQPRCGECGLTILGEYTEDQDGVYHVECYKQRKLPRCDVCLQPIEGDYVKDLWGNISHTSHNGKPYKMCSSCSVIVSGRTSKGGFLYSDGRVVCGRCRANAVFHPSSVAHLTHTVIDTLARSGFGDFPDNVTVTLVDLHSMKSKSGSDKKTTKGFTRTSKTSVGSFTLYSSHEIFILYGLPELEFKGVLAHELIHAWLNARKITLSRKETEGFCNIGSMLVYRHHDTPLAAALLDNMQNDPDPIYGDGYRSMLKRLEQNGLPDLIEKVQGN